MSELSDHQMNALLLAIIAMWLALVLPLLIAVFLRRKK
jgi:hypothetical protein